MTASRDSIRVDRIHLLRDEPDREINAAFDHAEAINPEFGLDWLRNLTATCPNAGETPYLFIARRAADDFVALALHIESTTGRAAALGNWYTSMYTPVVQSENPQLLMSALFRHLASRERVTSIRLSPMDASSAIFTDIQQALAKSGWRGTHSWRCFSNWYLDLQSASYPDYLTTRPSRLRNTIARKTRKFLAQGKGELQLVHSSDDLPMGIEQFNAVYRRSWKQQEPYPEFIPSLIELAARKGWLRLGIARYEGAPVAAQIWLVANKTASIFKLAYDEEFKRLSPGTVLSAYLMQSAIERDGVAQVDYLTGDDAYKRDWMNASRGRHGIAAFNPGTYRGMCDLGSHSLRRLARKVLGQRRS